MVLYFIQIFVRYPFPRHQLIDCFVNQHVGVPLAYPSVYVYFFHPLSHYMGQPKQLPSTNSNLSTTQAKSRPFIEIFIVLFRLIQSVHYLLHPLIFLLKVDWNRENVMKALQ